MLKEKTGVQWRVLIGCFLCMFLVQGCLQTFSIFIPQISKDTGWSVASVAFISTPVCISAFFFNTLITKALKKISPKTMLIIGCFFLILHLSLYSVCRSIYMLWIVGILAGITIAWGTAAPCTIIITNWFEKNRSQYVAAVAAGSMFGSVVLNPVIAVVIDRVGWRKAYIFEALVFGGLAMLAVLLLVKSSPEGEKTVERESRSKTASSVRKDGKYWLIAAGIFLIGLSTNTENYLPAFWQSRGMSNTTSSLILSCYALFAAVGAIFMSKVNDSLGGKKYVLITSFLFAVPVLIMAYTGVVSVLPALIVCCIPLSLGCKKASILTPPLIVNEAFGRENYASSIGFFAAMLQLGIAASTPVIGFLLNYGYEAAFTAMAALNILGMVLIMFVPMEAKSK